MQLSRPRSPAAITGPQSRPDWATPFNPDFCSARCCGRREWPGLKIRKIRGELSKGRWSGVHSQKRLRRRQTMFRGGDLRTTLINSTWFLILVSLITINGGESNNSRSFPDFPEPEARQSSEGLLSVPLLAVITQNLIQDSITEIGRASCRERV